jgi:3'-phosphoadenosine 5'-phosphosulfate sulfotransferase (PAPS reductase)/FAD synthetase
MKATKDNPVIAWWSGGVTSAVACKIAIDLYGLDNVRIVFIDTHNEDSDTYRFMRDCEKWYEKKIETISNPNYSSIQDVWAKYKGLNVSVGATCSLHLKMKTREQFQKENRYSFQAFGFDIDEPKRAKAFTHSYEAIRPIYPLLMFGYTKRKCMEIIGDEGITIPRAYSWGFNNNNCLKTGCVQGGIGYWQKMKDFFPEKFAEMAKVEHELTNAKGQPVTMLKDQGKDGGLVFLLPHPDYPNMKDLSMMKGRPPKPLVECNGFCGSNDLMKNETEGELNYF